MSSTATAPISPRVNEIAQLAARGTQAIDADLPRLMAPDGKTSLVITKEQMETALKGTPLLTTAMMRGELDVLHRQIGLQFNNLADALSTARSNFASAQSKDLLEIHPDNLGKYLEGDKSVATKRANGPIERARQFTAGLELLSNVAAQLDEGSAVGMIFKSLHNKGSAVAEFMRNQ